MWRPISEFPVGNTDEWLFYQPELEFRNACMMVGTYCKQWASSKAPSFSPSYVGGWEYDYELEHPTHFAPLPEPPAP